MPRELGKRFLLETHFGGFCYIARSENRIQKLFWTLVMCACITGLVAQEGLTVWNYINALPATSFRVEPQTAMKLPNAVICLANGFDAERVRQYSLSENFMKFLQLGFGMVFRTVGQERFWNVYNETATNFSTLIGDKNMSYTELLDHLSFSPDDLFAEGCWINGVRSPCIVKKFWFPPGLCFEIQSPMQYTVSPVVLSAIAGITIILRSRKERQYDTGIRDGGVNHGMYLMLSNGVEVEDVGTLVPENSYVDVGLEQSRTITVSSRKNRCVPDISHNTYLCALRCFGEKMMRSCKKCHFVDFASMMEGNLTCSPIDLQTCIVDSENGQRLFNRATHLAVFTECYSEICEKSCEKLEYKMTVNSYPWSDVNETKADGQVTIDLHYVELEIAVIEQFYPTSLGDLFGLIGGLFGLWIGGSIIAIVHLMSFWLINKDTQLPSSKEASRRSGGAPKNSYGIWAE